MTQHTPGPWKVEYASANASHEIRGPSREGIAYTGAWRTEHREEQLANARLIAAAPDLLHACHKALSTLPDLYDPLRMSEEDHQRAADLADALNAAIYKASAEEKTDDR